jgi:HTH-type transcriptional regulator / antitoxin HigA
MKHAADFHVDPPGVFIKDELEARGWDQSDLAFIVGKSLPQLNAILSGKDRITTKWAQLFGDAFDVNPQFFINLQAMYDLHHSVPAEPGVRIRADWVSKLPVREMINRGWIEDTEADLLDLQMMRFFRVNHKSEIPFLNEDYTVAHAAKKTSYEEIRPAQWAWLHRVRIIAETIDAPHYSREKLINALPEIRAHMNDKDDLGEIPSILLRCGVRTVIVEALAGARIDGVCTWIDDQPVIGLSLRLHRLDNLCFVVRHEIEHVLNENGKTIDRTHIDVFDEDRDTSNLPEEEKHADSEAAKFLVPQDKFVSFMARKGKYISEKDVLAFAARHNIHPAVVIGQIHHYRHKQGDEKAYAFLRKYLTDIRDNFMDWRYRDGWGYAAPVGL